MGSPLYRVSLVFTILLTAAAFFTLLGWVGRLINGEVVIPWLALGLLMLAAVNCSIRKRVINRR